MEQQYQRVPGASAQSQSVLYRISQLVTAARSGVGQAIPPAVSTPQPNPPAFGVPSELDQTVEHVKIFAYGLQSYQNRSPAYANLYRDAQGLLSQLEALSLLQQRGVSGWQFQQAAQAVRSQSEHISQSVRQADKDVQTYWWDTQSMIQRLAMSNPASSGGYFSTNQPVVIHQPSWTGLPYQPYTPVSSNRNQKTIEICDRLVAVIDGYTNTLRPLENRNRNIPAMIGRLQDLRHATLVLRHLAGAGAYGSNLTGSADQLMNSYQNAARAFASLVASDASLNSPLFMQIGELIQVCRMPPAAAIHDI